MDLLKIKFDENYFGLSQSEILIKEILKPIRPFEYYRPNQKIPLKYKNPEVSKIKKYKLIIL